MQSAKLRQAQPESSLRSLVGSMPGIGLVALVVVGISGSLYKLVSADGLVATLFERSPAGGMLSLGGTGLVVLCAWATGLGSKHGHRVWLSNLVVYGSAAAGSLFLLRYWWTGVF